jgi:single-stranded DNA-specific DHH superfamily exonuclease
MKREKNTSVVYQENWHKGVMVLLPRLIETYYRPTLVLPKAVINMPPQHVP